MQIGLSPLQSGDDFGVTLAQCEQAEALGFDSIWLGEHHNHSLLYPTPLLVLAAIAARTERIRLGTGVLLMPLYHPVTVAEEGAMVDMISRGRLILGLGAGYAPEEFAAFGLTTSVRGSRLEEGAALLRRLWTEEHVTHSGSHFQVTDVTIGPRPTQQPRPPIWFAGWVDRAIERAARLGDGWLGGPSATFGELSRCVSTFRDARSATGNPDGEIALIRYVLVAESRAEAYSIAGDATLEVFENTYFRWLHPVVKRPAGELTIEALARDRLVIGDPDQCVRAIRRFRDELGIGHLVCRISIPGISHEATARSLNLFTKAVLPALDER